MNARIIEGTYSGILVKVEDATDPIHTRVRLQEGERKGCVIYVSNQNLDFSDSFPEEIESIAPNSHDNHHDDKTHAEQHENAPIETKSTLHRVKEFFAQEYIIGIAVGLLILGILIFGVVGNSKPPEKQLTKIEIITGELNELNTLDAKDVEIRNEAQKRIDSRKQRKEEILQTLKFYK